MSSKFGMLVGIILALALVIVISVSIEKTSDDAEDSIQKQGTTESIQETLIKESK